MKRSNRVKKQEQQEIALSRINKLFKQAEIAFKKDPKISNKYVGLARRISLKYKVPFSKQQKIQYCKSCKFYLIPGQNVRIRLNKGKTVVKCLNCNKIARFIYK